MSNNFWVRPDIAPSILSPFASQGRETAVLYHKTTFTPSIWKTQTEGRRDKIYKETPNIPTIAEIFKSIG